MKMSPVADHQPDLRLTPTVLSQFIRLDACRRFLWFQLHPQATHALQQRYGTHPRPLSPLLAQEGQRFEQEVTRTLAAQHRVIDLRAHTPAETLAALSAVDREPVILTQAPLEGRIGGWWLQGRADLIEVVRDRQGGLHVLVADIKASREERLEHRLQVALYVLLLEEMCRQAGAPLQRSVGAVVHRDDARAFRTLHDPELHFDLAPYRHLALHLLSGPDAPLAEVLAADLDALPFALSTRCDGCFFNEICLPRAAERADLALVPEVSRPLRAALHAHDIRDLYALADLYLPSGPEAWEPNPRHAARLALLQRDPLLAGQIERLVARARAVLRRLDPEVAAPALLPDAPPAPLPSRAAAPHLIEVLLDLQVDDLTGGVYLAAALVRGPHQERCITRMSAAPPLPAVEAALLTEFAQALETALRQVATDEAPPLHLAVYDRRAQRVALEACTRHAQHHPLLAALVAWLEEQPQVRRITCARLQEIVRAQRNLRLTCDSLYAVASAVWRREGTFAWTTATHDFRQLFREGIFDTMRRFVRDGDGLRSARPTELEALLLEATSRFGSALPGQYAYAIWNDAAAVPTRDDLLAFAEHRLRALAHLQDASSFRERQVDVPRLPLAQLEAQAAPPDLRRALIAFMEVEHQAALADLLAHVRLPIGRRVLNGRAALLQAISATRDTARFRLLAPASAAHLRFKVGDWAVLNEADDRRGPWETLQGRLAIITALDDETIELELLSISQGGQFRLAHQAGLRVEPRCCYTLDEMADDLLGDRLRATLDALETNPLAQWLLQPATMRAPRPGPIDDVALRHAADRLLARQLPPTAAQRDVIVGGSDLPLRLVQGPPGTGKSHTLGLAVVARLLAAAEAGTPLRVAVTAKTHSAVQVALSHIARAWQAWPVAERPLLLSDLPIVKLGGERLPEDAPVGWLDPRRNPKRLRQLVEGACVIGGTPGGLSTLLEQVARGTSQAGCFDLLVIDEASQMSLPEGLLAASCLQAQGQMIVVGDHRQMPPIIVHRWEAMCGPLRAWQPERSLFRWLLDERAPLVALDRSFRLHREQAAFLQRVIYRADGIAFHSQRDSLLPAQRFDDALVDAALRWDVPLTVIEHAERASRQHNPFEVELVTELVRACLALGLDGHQGVGVVVPHRAQKAALRARLPELAAAEAIDTVERFQGGERDVIIVACTASEPDYILSEADFLLDAQRLNVALSRARKKVIVVAAATIFSALPTELEIFERLRLWQQLRAHVADHPLWSGVWRATAVRVAGPPARPAG